MNHIDVLGYEKRGKSLELVVVIHAYMSSSAKLRSVRALIAHELPNADLYIPDYDAGWSSNASPINITQRLLDDIDRLWVYRKEQSPEAYQKIIFIGHSLGSLLVRKLYVCACGELPLAPFEQGLSATMPRPWASKVERIILLAGMNRGWRISHHLSLGNAILWSIGSVVGNILPLVRKGLPLIFSMRKGAPFIAQLRIHWIYMKYHMEEKKLGDALTVQLLGSIDDMVSPEDNVDLIAGHDFVYLDIPYSGHANVIEMDDSAPVPNIEPSIASGFRTIGEVRSSVFREALLQDKKVLLQRSILPADLPPEKSRLDVSDVVFVMHGIRDLGYWTHKVARRVLEQGRRQGINQVVLATETSSYGYFPLLPFLLPSQRRKKVEWLMDQYVETLALYPNAKFSFVGHSNGTYLLTSALQDYPACRFKHVLLAGSVVRTHYDWRLAFSRGQVEKVLNYIATADWVVAFFPRAIQMLGIQDLGSAGHDGFSTEDKGVEQIKYVRGGHSAALVEANWDAIAHFILTGTPQDPPPGIKASSQELLVKLPGLAAPLIWILISIALFFVFSTLWSLGVQEWQKTLLSAGFAWLIWKLVTVI